MKKREGKRKKSSFRCHAILCERTDSPKALDSVAGYLENGHFHPINDSYSSTSTFTSRKFHSMNTTSNEQVSRSKSYCARGSRSRWLRTRARRGFPTQALRLHAGRSCSVGRDDDSRTNGVCDGPGFDWIGTRRAFTPYGVHVSASPPPNPPCSFNCNGLSTVARLSFGLIQTVIHIQTSHSYSDATLLPPFPTVQSLAGFHGYYDGSDFPNIHQAQLP